MQHDPDKVTLWTQLWGLSCERHIASRLASSTAYFDCLRSLLALALKEFPFVVVGLFASSIEAPWQPARLRNGRWLQPQIRQPLLYGAQGISMTTSSPAADTSFARRRRSSPQPLKVSRCESPYAVSDARGLKLPSLLAKSCLVASLTGFRFRNAVVHRQSSHPPSFPDEASYPWPSLRL